MISNCMPSSNLFLLQINRILPLTNNLSRLYTVTVAIRCKVELAVGCVVRIGL